MKEKITAIPWYYFPPNLTLSTVDLPSPPSGIKVEINETSQAVIQWTPTADVTYSIYRTDLRDTLQNGKSRRVYQRIAENVSGGEFIDADLVEGAVFAYIIYARNSAGVISSHSRETVESGLIKNLQLSATATTVHLSWRPFIPAVGTLKGYNIYRKTESGVYDQPVAYCGLDTTFVDSRLAQGKDYLYKVTARIDNGEEFGQSEEVAIRTEGSAAGYYRYANLKVAVIIYQNTNGGSIADSEIPKMKKMLDIAKLFYWRNSEMKLNVEFTYYPWKAYKDFGDPDDSWGSVSKTAADLKTLGVMNTQYDIIFRITPAVNGYWSYGVVDLGLPGPARQTGFSQSQWPMGTGVIYPGNDPEINYALTWIFVHECQHAIDAVYDANGFPEMYHGDQPWVLPVACGEQFDFQSKIFRTFKEYEYLQNNWGDIYEAVDADGDGFPDNDKTVALDEARFGSNSTITDTDGDSYSDKAEALDGAYTGSDPNRKDTDGDSIEDSQDPFPRFPIKTTIPQYTPLIDGSIEEGWPLIDDTVSFATEGFSSRLYMSYDDDSLYLAIQSDYFTVPAIYFDFQGDGWWHSSGNTIMRVNPTNGTFSEFHSWDASDAVKNYSLSQNGPGGMWDDDAAYQSQFHMRVIYPKAVHLKVSKEIPQQIEIAIARRDYAGLTLQPGTNIGLNISYSNINRDNSFWATTFDQYEFVNLKLENTTSVEDNGRGSVITEFALGANYPNPFNPVTRIQYSIPGSGHVRLGIFNSLGQKVRTLVSREMPAGKYEIEWDGKDDHGKSLPSGIYFYRLQTGAHSQTNKMLLLR
ncbi:MAG: FlgD immunoglobulin-like domain containing protein [Calditrichia bacterium]